MSSTWLDRSIAWTFPHWGLRRAISRHRFEAVRSYDAAKSRRASSGWTSGSNSANAEIGPKLGIIRDRSRDLVRNTSEGRRIKSLWAAHTVGSGIVPQTKDQRVQNAWLKWAGSAQCDANNQINFYGIEGLIARTVVECGEAVVRARYRKPDMFPNLIVPLQLQVLEGDHIDSTKHGNVGLNGNKCVYGIELDKYENRIAYWLYANHPGDSNGGWKESLRIPANEVLHIYWIDRPGQMRGVPWLHAIVNDIRDLDDYELSILMRAKMEACVGMVIHSPDTDVNLTKKPGSTETEDPVYKPGMVAHLDPGEEVEFVNPTTGGGYDEFRKATLQSIASGVDLTYDMLTSDLTGANYSSLKAGKTEFRRVLNQYQTQMLIPMLCRPVWGWFTAAGILAGTFPNGDYQAKWRPPRNEYIDPNRDTQALQREVRSGFRTLYDVIAENGRDPEELLSEIDTANARLDETGIILDSDPRKVTFAGMVQPESKEGE